MTGPVLLLLPAHSSPFLSSSSILNHASFTRSFPSCRYQPPWRAILSPFHSFHGRFSPNLFPTVPSFDSSSVLFGWRIIPSPPHIFAYSDRFQGQRAVMIVLLLLAVSISYTLAETCSDNRIPFGFEVHKNGHVNLLCSRPNCFDKRYAECDERPQRDSCEGNSTWVGGLERTIDGRIFLQCCSFEPLATYGEKLFDDVKVHRGEYFEGEEKTEEGDDWVVYFDLITNIRRFPPDHPKELKTEHYELSVSRYHCGREPEEPPAWKKSHQWPDNVPSRKKLSKREKRKMN